MYIHIYIYIYIHIYAFAGVARRLRPSESEPARPLNR